MTSPSALTFTCCVRLRRSFYGQHPSGIVSFVELSVGKIVNVELLMSLPVFPLTSLAVTLTRHSLELMLGTLHEYLPSSGLFEAMGFQGVPESFEKDFPN